MITYSNSLHQIDLRNHSLKFNNKNVKNYKIKLINNIQQYLHHRPISEADIYHFDT